MSFLKISLIKPSRLCETFLRWKSVTTTSYAPRFAYFGIDEGLKEKLSEINLFLTFVGYFGSKTFQNDLYRQYHLSQMMLFEMDYLRMTLLLKEAASFFNTKSIDHHVDLFSLTLHQFSLLDEKSARFLVEGLYLKPHNLYYLSLLQELSVLYVSFSLSNLKPVDCIVHMAWYMLFTVQVRSNLPSS